MITLKGNTANLEGLSTDQKPNDVPVNTEFRELDTNCRFYFTGESWEEIPSSGGGGGSGTSNYNELENKPQIAGVTLSGNKTLANLGIQGELSFDNAPTEDSTNPVTSGGVYEALQAKQDTLTIDDTPTEDSENPVTSGGVYSALEDKQDNLVFDGTYDSSTNKAATESTVSDAVSTAIGNLTNSDVGLGNVTNNTQIKALSGSVTSGGIVTFGADGATVSDSGKTIETNLSNSNDNIPTSKAVRDKVAGSATMASNYATDSSESNITSATTINDAIEQLDYRTATNKTNILSNVTDGFLKSYNMFPLSTASGESAGTIATVDMSLSAGTYKISWKSNRTDKSTVMTFFNGGTQVAQGGFTNSTNRQTTSITLSSAIDKITLYSNDSVVISDIMLFDGSLPNDTPYLPYALSNAELTSLENQNESNIALRPQVLVRSVTNITSTTTLDDTGVSYTIPSNAYVRITATARYGQSNPEEIMIWTGSSVFAHTTAITGDNNFSLTATTLIGGISGDTTAKIYARFRGANTNAIILEVESVPNPS